MPGSGYNSEKLPRSSHEILADLDAWKKKKTEYVTYALVHHFALHPSASITLETRAGNKIYGVEISDRGVISHFIIGPHSIVLTTAKSLNVESDATSSLEEDNIRKEHEAALIEYFAKYPDDRPE